MRAQYLAAAVVAVILSPPAAAIGLFESHYNAPGNRANAMAGAFTAAANDASAIWYNPAGLGSPYTASNELTVDYGNMMRRSVSAGTEAGDESEVRYVGAILPSGRSASNKMRAAIAYYHPAQINFATQQLENRYDLLMFGAGFNNNNFSWGYSAMYAMLESDYADAFSAEDNSELMFSLGGIVHVVRSPKFKLNLGGVYMFGADWYFSTSEYDNAALLETNVPGIPNRMAYGANAQITIPRGLVSINYDIEEWSTTDSWDALGTNGTQRNNLGIETLVALNSRFLLALRWGTSSGETIDTSAGNFQSQYDSLSLSTWGVGIGINNQHFFDYTVENRALTTNLDAENDYSISSLSYSLQF